MRVCVNCKNELQPKQIVYNVNDLGADILKVLEETIGREAKVHDILCSDCFSNVVQPSEEEVDASMIEAEIQDPLLGPLEMQVKKSASSEEEEELDEEHDPEPIVKMVEKSTASSVEEEFEENEEEHDQESMVSTDSGEEEEDKHDSGLVVNLKRKTCIVCSETLNKHRIINLPLGPERDAVENYICPKKLSRHGVVCKDCLQKIMGGNGATAESSVKNDTVESTKVTAHNKETESTFIHIPNYYFIGGSHAKCFVKDCKIYEKSRKVVPKYMRRILLENFNVFLSSTARSCSGHRKEYYRDWSHLRDKKLYKQKFNSQQVEEMLEFLRNDP